jgi:hypothetical protein
MSTITHTSVTIPGSDTPDLAAITALLRESNSLKLRAATALEAIAQNGIAVAEVYQAGRSDERADWEARTALALASP